MAITRDCPHCSGEYVYEPKDGPPTNCPQCNKCIEDEIPDPYRVENFFKRAASIALFFVSFALVALFMFFLARCFHLMSQGDFNGMCGSGVLSAMCFGLAIGISNMRDKIKFY